MSHTIHDASLASHVHLNGFTMTNPTLAEMMTIALDAYIESLHSCKANDECRLIRDEIEAQGFTTVFGRLADYDTFPCHVYGSTGSLRIIGQNIKMLGNTYGTGTRAHAFRADVDGALYRLANSGHNTL